MDEFSYDCFLFSDGSNGGSDGNRDKTAPYQKEQTADAAAANGTNLEGGKDETSSLSSAAEKSKNKRSLGEANDDDDAKPAKRQQKQQQGARQQQQQQQQEESDTEYGDLDRENIDEELALFDNPNVFASEDHFACYPGT
jgi:hypothetical protein